MCLLSSLYCCILLEMGEFVQPCEDDLVVKISMQDSVPYFNAPVFLENKEQVGKVDEIFGPIRDYVSFEHKPIYIYGSLLQYR